MDLGLIGRGRDPMQRILTMNSPEEAARYLRSEEQRRLRQIREIVLASTNNLPMRVGDIVEGGPLKPGEDESTQGVVVGHQTRLGKVALSRPEKDEHGRLLDAQGHPIWEDEDEVVQGLVLLRKGAESLPALTARAGQDRGAQQHARALAARCPHRGVLRPRRPDQRDDGDRRGEPAGRHLARDRDPADVLEQCPQRARSLR